MNTERPSAGPAKADSPEEPGFIRLAGESLHALRDYAGGVGELASLEVRLAATTALRMAAFGAAMAVIGIGAWLLLQTAAAFWLAGLGWPVAAVLAGLAVVNGLVVWGLTVYVKHLSARLTFPATRRLLFERTESHAADESHPRAAAHDRDAAPADRAA